MTLYLVELSIQIWEIKIPKDRFWYRLQVLILPIFMFPLFQFINPQRGSFYFTEDIAFFATTRWMKIGFWGIFSVGFLFITLLLLTAILTFLQEVVPVIKTILFKRSDKKIDFNSQKIDLLISEIGTQLKINKPPLVILDDETPIAFTRGIRNPVLFLSKTLINQLNDQQMKSVLAHEMSHIACKSNLTTLILYILRMITFFNPVTLLAFRKIIQDEEHICDDKTISLTKDSQSLALSLTHFSEDQVQMDGFYIPNMKRALRYSAHDLLIRERILRLKNKSDLAIHPFEIGKYSLTFVAIWIINYFIV